jgi:hypothetical protein
MARTARLGSILFAWLAAASPAFANGRYPSAQQLLLDPTDPNRMWLRATYGLLTSSDAGKNWGWICERAVGYGSGEDPMLAVTADGTVLAGTTGGLVSTVDAGCTWSPTPVLDGYVIDDLATESDVAHVVALANFVKDDGIYELTVWRSDDSGHSFGAESAPIGHDLFGRTIDVAPSDPTRLYVTAVPAHGERALPPDAGARDAPSEALTVGSLFVSRDRGASWQEHTIRGTSLDDQPFIAAVHPSNPDVLFVRTRGPDVVEGFVTSRLLYSDTAGASFREVFRASADMLGFSLVDDGNRVLLGLGDSRDAFRLRKVDQSALGIYRGALPGFVFERALRGQVGCLTSAAQGLFVCGSNATTLYELGLSHDIGSTATRIFRFGEQIDLLKCDPATSVGMFCETEWPSMCREIGKCSVEIEKPPLQASPPSNGDGCCGSAGASAAANPKASTARSAMVPDPPWLLALASALTLLRRSRTRTNG